MGCSVSVQVPPPTVIPKAADPLRLVVVNSALDGLDILTTAVLAEHAVTVFDPKKVTLEDLATDVEAYNTKFVSIAILCHGSEGALKLLDGAPMDIKSLKSSKVASFWKRLGACVAANGRIDLLGCSVAGGNVGSDFIRKLEEVSKVNFAASIDKTSAAAGAKNSKKEAGDLHLETDDVNAGPLYFNMKRMEKYPHSLGLGGVIGAGVGIYCGGGVAGGTFGYGIGNEVGGWFGL